MGCSGKTSRTQVAADQSLARFGFSNQAFVTKSIVEMTPRIALGREFVGPAFAYRFRRFLRSHARQIIRKRTCGAKIAGDSAVFPNDESGHLRVAALHILVIHTVIANLRIRHRDDLTPIARISQDFLDSQSSKC